MTNKEAAAVLTEAFARLNKQQRANLRWHAAQKTRICCGKEFEIFAINGAG